MSAISRAADLLVAEARTARQNTNRRRSVPLGDISHQDFTKDECNRIASLAQKKLGDRMTTISYSHGSQQFMIRVKY